MCYNSITICIIIVLNKKINKKIIKQIKNSLSNTKKCNMGK
jgi:hypothetical protein